MLILVDAHHCTPAQFIFFAMRLAVTLVFLLAACAHAQTTNCTLVSSLATNPGWTKCRWLSPTSYIRTGPLASLTFIMAPVEHALTGLAGACANQVETFACLAMFPRCASQTDVTNLYAPCTSVATLTTESCTATELTSALVALNLRDFALYKPGGASYKCDCTSRVATLQNQCASTSTGASTSSASEADWPFLVGAALVVGLSAL